MQAFSDMKGIFDPNVLWPFDKKLISKLVMNVKIRDYTVSQVFFYHHRKDVRLPQQLQRAMAAEAEAAREARAKVIAAEGEHKSSRALAHAAEVIAQSPAALQVNSIVYDRRLCP